MVNLRDDNKRQQPAQRIFKPRTPVYDEPEESEEESEEEDRYTKKRRTHLMDHLSPKEQNLVHQYYHEIGQKGSNLHQGYLDSLPEDEQRAVRKFLHAVQVKKNIGEHEAEEELDREYSGFKFNNIINP